LVMATNRDNFRESPEVLETSRVNIANSLGDGVTEYPKESVYFVSGKRKLLGLITSRKLERNPVLMTLTRVSRRLLRTGLSSPARVMMTRMKT